VHLRVHVVMSYSCVHVVIRCTCVDARLLAPEGRVYCIGSVASGNDDKMPSAATAASTPRMHRAADTSRGRVRCVVWLGVSAVEQCKQLGHHPSLVLSGAISPGA
jgi:hypothetical protein